MTWGVAFPAPLCGAWGGQGQGAGGRGAGLETGAMLNCCASFGQLALHEIWADKGLIRVEGVMCLSCAQCVASAERRALLRAGGRCGR